MKNRNIREGIAPVLAALAFVSAGFALQLGDRSAIAAATEQPAASVGASYTQVAPVLQERCASCHNPQGGAPFNLLTYEDAKQWSGQILEVTQSRYMPPWLPAPGKGDFAGERRLSDAELAAIRAWVGAGAPGPSEGGAGTTAPPAPEPAEWPLGRPDAVLTLPEPVTLRGNGPDVFTNLVVPFPGDQTRSLQAIQIRPSDPQAVRGVLLSIDESGRLRQTDGWKQGIAGMETPEGPTAGATGLVYWTPASQALKPRPGESWTVKPRCNLVLTAHLKTTGKKLALQFQIGLYYQPKAALGTGRARVLRLAHHAPIEIPAGASITLEDSYTLAQASSATTIYPRAHFLAHSFDAYATTPGGKQVWLLSIPKWDVDWVEVYQYRHPVMLPRGSVVHWKVSYDNSAENPHNPSDPPVAVHGGSGATDEADALLLEMEPAAGTNALAWRKMIESAGK